MASQALVLNFLKLSLYVKRNLQEFLRYYCQYYTDTEKKFFILFILINKHSLLLYLISFLKERNKNYNFYHQFVPDFILFFFNIVALA